MEQHPISSLLDSYLTGDLSADDRSQLAALAADPANKERLEAFVAQVMVSGKYGDADDVHVKERLDSFLNAHIDNYQPRSGSKRFYMLPWFRFSAAVVLLVVGIFSLITFYKQLKQPSIALKPAARPSILPGTNKATLTLADGTTVLLDNTLQGSIARQGGMRVIQLAPGHLAYAPDKQLSSAETTNYNTISTPKGGQYQIVLSDGSHVWLNAASSVKFPAAFPESERSVEITGEVYIEVARNVKKPFIVKSSRQRVEVLGTAFNISAYEDDNVVKTTLVEGSIKIEHGSEGYLLEPGKQSVVERNGVYKILAADVRHETAWKNGLFEFSKADIRSVMRQLSRWYNIDILYSGTPPTMRFSGEIERNLNLNDVVEILEESGVKLKLEGRILKVLP